MKPRTIHTSLFLLLVMSLMACSHDEENQEKKDESAALPPTYTLATVRAVNNSRDLTLPADLKPYYATRIFPKVKSFVQKVAVDRGSRVRKGQLLAVLEAPELTAQLAEAQTKITLANSSLTNDKALLNRLLKASQTAGVVAASEIDLARSRVAADSSLLAAAQANVKVARQMTTYLRLVAPFDGTITERNVSAGDLVGPDGNTANAVPLFVLEDNSRLRLTLAVPELYADAVRDAVGITFSVPALPGQTFTAKLARTSESLQENVRALITEFDVPNANRKLSAGMYADVTLPLHRRVATLVVPATAVVNSTEQVFVVAVRDGKAHRVSVRKGLDLGDETEVFGSLRAGDQVVLAASDETQDGDIIKSGSALSAHVK
ncbi:efflux RND transporter periplasmic adaptor subunit [Spirosoma sp. RP8]|uniref:Efflux RND transporter periplasmic adaptor subunit n=1 Tax=Spirosoma liriopis TaxID=2937440 RepID=A0ABT0HUF4_9BACT|nr:efflux RND transporter periplasmic adaptor subunit [Spirosoma liriopis]MCK8495472.1 efflux RND transporter periplasmic adaptor subunit [Spirosoma liriopis]